MKIAVIGMGKIGLPLAVQFASKGHQVVGVDVQQSVVDVINSGKEPVPGEAFLEEKISELVPAGNLVATTDYASAIPGVDAIVIVVPLFVNDATWEPDFGWMTDATKSFAAHMTKGTLVSYETTLPVGTTRNRWLPLIEEVSGLKAGENIEDCTLLTAISRSGYETGIRVSGLGDTWFTAQPERPEAKR